MIHWILNLPTWMMIRVLGLASYCFLFLGVASGILQSMPGSGPLFRKRIYRYHTFFNGIGLGLGLLHALLLIVDTFMPFSWRELLVPFAATHNPILNGMGTIVLYGLILLAFTSDLRNKIRKVLWHTIHLLAYPVFFLALVHGVGVGTDTATGWVKGLYLVTGCVVAGMTVIRLMIGGERPDAHSARGRRSEAGHAAPVQAEQRISQR